jgi:hypothetical protein
MTKPVNATHVNRPKGDERTQQKWKSRTLVYPITMRLLKVWLKLKRVFEGCCVIDTEKNRRTQQK